MYLWCSSKKKIKWRVLHAQKPQSCLLKLRNWKVFSDLQEKCQNLLSSNNLPEMVSVLPWLVMQISKSIWDTASKRRVPLKKQIGQGKFQLRRVLRQLNIMSKFANDKCTVVRRTDLRFKYKNLSIDMKILLKYFSVLINTHNVVSHYLFPKLLCTTLLVLYRRFALNVYGSYRFWNRWLGLIQIL